MAVRALAVLAGLALLAVPPFLPKYFLEVLISILFFAYLGLAWNLLGGYAGQFSFGHAAFFGIGAYTSSLLLLRIGLSPWLGMLAGGLLATAFQVTATTRSISAKASVTSDKYGPRRP